MAVSPPTKRTRIYEDFEITHRLPGDNTTKVNINRPFTYLIALR